jgi:4-hydroxy-tetrahydrodipicolinate synthase
LKFTGSICAIVTPFDPSGAIDLDAFAKLVRWHAHCGTSAIVVGGSTGESGALDDAELDRLVECALASAGASMRIIAGCGAAATYKSLRMSRRMAALGAHATLVVTPFYVRPTQEGLARHYRALADDGGIPLIAYNVPSRTGCDLLPETVARLVDHPAIVGIKEARAEPERMDALLALKSERFAVLSGDDPTALRALQRGADGVISVAANIVPATFARLCASARSDADAARALDAELAPLYRFLGAEPNPIPVKWLLAQARRAGGALRLPLTELSVALEADGAHCAELARRLETRFDAAADRAA